MSTHIRAKKGEIAKTILLPGDPLRAKFIAENFLENPKQYNNVRGMLGYTGTYTKELKFLFKEDRYGNSIHCHLCP